MFLEPGRIEQPTGEQQMPLEWFEYYALTNDVKNLKDEIEGLKKDILKLKEEIQRLKKQ
jgi:archaellum component FlaC